MSDFLTDENLCHDCGVDTTPYDEHGEPIEGAWEHYMVRDEVWDAARPGTAEGGRVRFLCVGCLEQRLRRELRPDDFIDAPINDPGWQHTPRLAARLTGAAGGRSTLA